MASLHILQRYLLLFVFVFIHAMPGFLAKSEQEYGVKPTMDIAMLADSRDADMAIRSWREAFEISRAVLSKTIVANGVPGMDRLRFEYRVAPIGFGQFARPSSTYFTTNIGAIERVQARVVQQEEQKLQDNLAPTDADSAVLTASALFSKESKRENYKSLLYIGDRVNTNEDDQVLARLRIALANLKQEMNVHFIAVAMSSNADKEELEAFASSDKDVVNMDVDQVVERISHPLDIPAVKPTAVPLPYPCPTEPIICKPELPCRPHTTPPPSPPCPNPPCPPCPQHPVPCPCPPPCPHPPCPTVKPTKPKQCPKAPYSKVGCFRHPPDSHRHIVWITPGVTPKRMPDWDKYLSTLVCQCSNSAKKRGFSYFGVKYYKPKHGFFFRGECFASSKKNKYLPARECIDSTTESCDAKDKKDCTGTASSIFCYKRKDDKEEEKAEEHSDELQSIDDDTSDDNEATNDDADGTVDTD